MMTWNGKRKAVVGGGRRGENMEKRWLGRHCAGVSFQSLPPLQADNLHLSSSGPRQSTSSPDVLMTTQQPELSETRAELREIV